jgi:lactate dehydrogenase-like 2-hydroxyacid dehydrogenase
MKKGVVIINTSRGALVRRAGNSEENSKKQKNDTTKCLYTNV